MKKRWPKHPTALKKKRAALRGNSREVLILKHVASEGAGTLFDFLKEKNIPVREVDLYENAVLPERVDALKAVILMGGPMNVYEEDRYLFLKRENEFIKKLLRKNVPCLGVCLGAQLIAKALGGKVYKAKEAEIGWMDITLTEDATKDRLFSVLKSPRLRVLQWHEDTFEMPKTAVRLASSPAVPNQAFRYKKNVYAFQFHVEVNRAMLKDWFKDSQDLNVILEDYETYQIELKGLTDRLYEKFFSLPKNQIRGDF